MTARGARRLATVALALVSLGLAHNRWADAEDSLGVEAAPGDRPEAAPEDASIPEPVGFVNDHAQVLDEASRAKLEAFLDQLKRKTGVEFAVLTVPTTAPETPSQYKVRVFERWGLGKKGEDNGLLMLFARDERELKFETGYGLEGTLPDALQSRIFRNEMRPRFRSGDFTGGITAGVLECARRIAAEKGVTLEWAGRELRYERERRNLPVWAILLIVLVLMILISSTRRRRRRRGWIDSGGWGSGWGGGFGGSGWGGGGFGGGGGGSFGGFGGGASGGGGGGGSW